MAILIFKSDIFKSSNKFVFYIILNICLYFFSAKKRYVKNTEIFLKKSKKKKQYCCECYKNLSEDEKQKLFDYRKNTVE